MITTEDRKLLMGYLEYSYIPFNSSLHQLKPRWTSGYWIRKSLVKLPHIHVEFGKLAHSAIIKKLPDFEDWNWIMEVVLKVWSECSFLHDTNLQDNLNYFLGSANRENTLETLIEIVKLKTEIDENCMLVSVFIEHRNLSLEFSELYNV